MKNNIKISLLIITVIAGFFSCKKYDGDSYDFTNKTEDYIRFTPGQNLSFNSTTADTVIGLDTFFYYVQDELSLNVETRVAFGEDVSFTYSIDIDEGTTNQMVGTLKKGTSAQKELLMFDESWFNTSDSVISGVITLINASGPTVGSLKIGYPTGSSNIKVPFTANKPNVLYPY